MDNKLISKTSINFKVPSGIMGEKNKIGETGDKN